MPSLAATPALPQPHDEQGRLAAMDRSGLLGTGPEAALNDLVRLAARLCATTSAEINLVGADHLHFVAAQGLGTPGGTVERELTFCTWAIAEPDRPLVVADAREDHRFSSNPFVVNGTIRSYAGYPLIVESHAIGTLCVHDPEPDRLDPDKLDSLQVLARAAQSHISLLRDIDDLNVLARTDALTGCANRRATDEAIERDLQRADVNGIPMSVAMIDLDRFKSFNDTRGHQAGDLLLQQAALAWRRSLRAGDLLGRWGGEEFCVLLPTSTIDQARVVADRLRTVVPDGQTCSIGVAEWDGREACADLVARADTALYEAKQAGRDRVVAAR